MFQKLLKSCTNSFLSLSKNVRYNFFYKVNLFCFVTMQVKKSTKNYKSAR